VRPSGQGAPVWQFEVALGTFERLDVRLLVDRDHQRALGRIEKEPAGKIRSGGKDEPVRQ